MQSLALALIVPLGAAQVAQAAADPGGLGRPDVPKSRVSKVEEFDGPGAKKARERVAREKKTNKTQAERARSEQQATWPQQGEATFRLAAGEKAAAQPGGLPVTLRPSPGAKSPADAKARVTVLDQRTARAAGITGVMLSIDADAADKAEIAVDYGSFASAVGGGWSQRLRLVQLPACVLTTPEKAECRTQRPLASENDSALHAVTAKVHLAETPVGPSPQLRAAAGADSTSGTVLAVTAAAAGSGESSSGTGNYSATPLSESSSWEAGGSSGSFTWSYDFTVPPAAAGPQPPLSLSYDSGSVDGRTATSNNQGTSVGEGFGLTDSYIERSYGSCDDDGHDDVFDLCWKYDNARLVLNGRSTRLVKDDDSGQWRLENDDASTVTRSTGADNGDNDGEHWTVTTGDGTRYVFGLNKLDGADTQRTDSVSTVPVFGDDSGEPGYSGGDSFGDRALTQAWRWNLDYVEDTRGNAATYWYTKESNYYKKNKSKTANASYTRGGYLSRIEYGLRKGALFTDKADAKVTFGYAERCTASDCSSLTKDTADNWPDVPYDAICSKDDDDCDGSGPTFFTRKRLTGIDTFSYNATSGAYDPVDSWDLVEEYLDGGDIGDTSDQVLTLKSIKRTAKAGTTAIAMNPVTITYQMRPNRVDATDDILPLTRPRISTITSETGAITTVTLSGEECVRSQVLNAAPDTNTRSCYPQFWHINGSANASIDWFHKYRVLAVLVTDPTAANESVERAYTYSGAAWHYSDDPFTKTDERTWSEWRGYAQVTALSGATHVTRSKTVSLYLQGMHGDRKRDGTTKSVSVDPLATPALGAEAITDKGEYAGQLREQVTYDGSTAISATINDPWSQETAKQTPPGAGAHVARFVRTKKVHNYTYLTASKSWRERLTSTSFDSFGMPVTVEDAGQVGKSSDETCTRTWYARNTGLGIINPVSRTRTVARTCATADTSLALPLSMDPAKPARGDVLADVSTVYDTANATTWSATQKPTKGLPTWTGRATGYAATADAGGDRLPSGWQRLSATTYDSLGRPLSVNDASANPPRSLAYTPADAGPLTRTVTTDPKTYKTTSFLDPRRGQPLRIYDVNLKKTELTYDALGRLTQVWLPNRTTGQPPNQKFDYHLNTAKPSWVSASTLKKDGETYNTTYTLYDALLRPLQTQSPTPEGGRLLTDTRYDTRGLAYETYSDIFDNTATPNATYTRAEYGEAPTQTQTVFDGAGRARVSTLYTYGVKKWSTTTSYTGDSVATTALEGGSAQRTITDVRGKTVETREYAGVSPADAAYGDGTGAVYTSTGFTYELDGQNRTITGPDKATWTYVHDLFGRQAITTDPDKGTTVTEFDELDRPVKSTDSLGTSVLTAYDVLGRVTGTWKNAKTDANRLTGHVYDTLLKGLPTSSTRYVGGAAGDAYTQAVTAYDSLDRATATELQLPANDAFVKAGAPAKLAFETYYNLDGTLKQNKEPAVGGLTSEILDYGYDALGNVTSVGSATGYLRDVDYSALSQPKLLTMGAGGSGNKNVYIGNDFEEGTGRLTRSFVTDETHGYMLQELNYTYDQAGNVTAISDPATLGGTGSAETQCFAYDGYRRLVEAWTPASQKCSDAPNASSLSGPAPYWSSYSYNDAGQRTSETVHSSTGDTKTTYCYTSTTQKHALTGTTTKADCSTPERKYDYDAAGNTWHRPGKSGPQTLDWSPEGKISKLTENGVATDYVYAADGSLLIRNTQNGERVLYAGGTELHLRANGTLWAQRYYGAGGVNAALRSNQTGTNKVTYLTGDQHNTSSLAINQDAGQTFTKRYTTPFGADRGKPLFGPWPDDKGFLGKTRDATTGLTHVGAREYDPEIGQFISVDPLLQADIPQTLNGYSYAAQNPVTQADPSGLGLACGPQFDVACPNRPDGTPGNGRPGEAAKPMYNCPSLSNPQCPGYTGGTASSKSGNTSSTPTPAERNRCGLFGCEPSENTVRYCQQNPIMCQISNSGPAVEQAGKQLWEFEKELLGIGAYEDCKGGDVMACLQLSRDAIFASKLKLFQSAIEKAVLRLCAKCFLAGTDVLMADGTTKDIEDVVVGDHVMATDPETGETSPEEVTDLIRTDGDRYFNELSIATGDGTDKLTATYEHPFWSPSERTWIEAGKLAAGMTLLTNDGTTVTVTANRSFAKNARTYNLTVDDLHTYYVLAGSTPVLVHNSGCRLFPNTMQGTLDRELALADRLGVTPASPGSAGFDSAISSGAVKWAVREDGSLVIIPKFVNGQEISHSVLTRGAPVRAAGEADIAGSMGDGYFGLGINNHSGHFLPSSESLEIGKEAFAAMGVHF